jgi:hypothetical protein
LALESILQPKLRTVEFAANRADELTLKSDDPPTTRNMLIYDDFYVTYSDNIINGGAMCDDL